MISLSQFSEHYGIFPYYLITNGYNDFVQFPIHLISEDVKVDVRNTSNALPGINIYSVSRDIVKLSRWKQIEAIIEQLVEVGKQKLKQLQYERDYRYWVCLVVSDSQCLFIDDEGVRESNYIPMGGTLNDIKLNLLAANTRHYNSDPFKTNDYSRAKTLYLDKYSSGNSFYEPMNLSDINAIKVESDFNTIRVSEHETEDKNIIIRFKNKTGNCFIDFTDANDYRVYCIDNTGYVMSRHYAFNNTSNFTIQTPENFILLVRD
jgi:hypothetical protein